MNGLTSRQVRTVTSGIHHVTVIYKMMLSQLKAGGTYEAIRTLNSIRPIVEVEKIMGRFLTTEEASLYLEAMSNIQDVELARAIGAAKILQDCRAACRKHIQHHDLQSAIAKLADAVKSVEVFYK